MKINIVTIYESAHRKQTYNFMANIVSPNHLSFHCSLHVLLEIHLVQLRQWLLLLLETPCGFYI